jgi:ABC-type antimicrobial peptide transport system permease subunit
VVLVGVAIGVIAAFASTRLLGTLLYDVKPVDPLVFAAMSLTMIGMGVLASYMPARRASAVDPVEALRDD